MVNLYHDTMPKSPDAITWPAPPVVLSDVVAGGDPDEFLDQLGYMLVGNAEEVSELLEVFGDRVIPDHDPDRVHSTDRYRATAIPKYDRFSAPLPDVEWPTLLPRTAMGQELGTA